MSTACRSAQRSAEQTANRTVAEAEAEAARAIERLNRAFEAEVEGRAEQTLDTHCTLGSEKRIVGSRVLLLQIVNARRPARHERRQKQKHSVGEQYEQYECPLISALLCSAPLRSRVL